MTSKSPSEFILLDHPVSVNWQSSPQASLSDAQSNIVSPEIATTSLPSLIIGTIVSSAGSLPVQTGKSFVSGGVVVMSKNMLQIIG